METHPARYDKFFASADGDTMEAWLVAMRGDEHARPAWGDDIAVQALCNLLNRPAIIWRRDLQNGREEVSIILRVLALPFKVLYRQYRL